MGPLRGIPFYAVPSCSVVGKPTDLLQLEPVSASVDVHSNVNLGRGERAKQVIGLAGQRLDHRLGGGQDSMALWLEDREVQWVLLGPGQQLH